MPDFFTNTRVVGLVFLVFSGAYLYFIQDIVLDFWAEEEVFNARSMPYLIGTCGVIVSLLLVCAPGGSTDWRSLRSLNILPLLILAGTISLYGLLLDILGFAIASFLFLSAGFILLGERRPLRVFLIAGLLVGLFWLIMWSLDIYLTPGEWFYWLTDD